jgi:hypothetical protein
MMIYEAVCAFLGVVPSFDPSPLLPSPDVPLVDLSGQSYRSEQELLREAVRSVYDIEADDAALRPLGELPAAQRAAHFDALRKNYRRRREFGHTTVRLPAGSEAGPALSGLGF